MKIHPIVSVVAIAVAGLVAGCAPSIEDPGPAVSQSRQGGTSLGKDASYFIRKWGNPEFAPSLNGTTVWATPEVHARVEFEKGVAVEIVYSNPNEKPWTKAQIMACLNANGTEWQPYSYDKNTWTSHEGHRARYLEGQEKGWMTVTSAKRVEQEANKNAGIPAEGY